MAVPRRGIEAPRAAVGLSAGDGPQDIEALRKRYEQLRESKTRAEANLENSRARLEELRKTAREQYGTDDLAELKGKLEQLKLDNERKRAEYQASLEKIETELKAVDENYQQAMTNETNT